ncbi:MAG: hypothetical protein OEW06_13830 [Gemmatimonadota bacterium]|nr:hypothetical protein [Gemmatimonadota bacterium]
MDEDLKRRYRELANELRDQLAAGSDDAEVAFPDGTPWRVHRDVDGALMVQTSSGDVQIRGRVWQPSAERPSDYPAAIPFLAETLAYTSLSSDPSRIVMVQWWKVHNGAQALKQLIRETLGDGWLETEPLSPTTEPPGERCQFVRGQFKRIISRTGATEWGGLLLMQVELPPAAV